MASSHEDKRRRLRSFIIIAILSLIIIWTYKLSHPTFTLIGAYSGQNRALNSSTISTSQPGHGAHSGSTSSSTISKASTLIGDFNGTVVNKAAIIIEYTYRPELVPLVLHFSSILGSSWPILIYTSVESMGSFSSSSALSRYTSHGLVQIRTLPQDVLFTDLETRNKFMTDTWLWEDLAPAEHILLFNSDSMLCANAARSVEDFFQYDFVGMPVQEKGHRGGLTLRKRTSILRVLESWDFEKDDKKDDEKISEDEWFHDKLQKLQDDEGNEGIEPESNGAVNLPDKEIQRTFSVESIEYPHPLGLHRVHKWNEDQRGTLDDWCPEYKLCSVEREGNEYPTFENGGLGW